MCNHVDYNSPKEASWCSNTSPYYRMILLALITDPQYEIILEQNTTGMLIFVCEHIQDTMIFVITNDP